MAIQSEAEMRRLFADLAAGDRIEVEQEVRVGQKCWPTKTVGTLVRTERRRHGLHFRRNPDDKVWSDVLVLRHEDGELTTLAVDEITKIRRLEAATDSK